MRTQNTPAGEVVHVGDTARISQRSGFARGFLYGNPCGAVFVKDLMSGAVLGYHRKRRPPMLGRRGSRLGSSSTTEPVAPGRRHGERRRHVGVGVGVGFLLRRRRRRGAFGTVTWPEEELHWFFFFFVWVEKNWKLVATFWKVGTRVNVYIGFYMCGTWSMFLLCRELLCPYPST